jgi:hypothetical protein
LKTITRAAASGAMLALLLAAAPAPVTLSQLPPDSPLDHSARQAAAEDLQSAERAGGAPLVLVGSAHLGGRAAALFVQIQSAQSCGSAGCSTSVYLPDRHGWRKVLDSVSGAILVDPTTHHGMHDLTVDGHDRWVWNGTAYVDTLPAPAVDLRHSRKKTAG